MSLQLSVAVKNAMLNGLIAAIGASPVLVIFSGSIPASTSAAITGTILATMNLPSTWLSAAANGVSTKAGTWQDLSADANGQAAGYRISASDGTSGHLQGTVTATGGGGDMTLDSLNFTLGQQVTVTGYTLTQPG